MEHRPYDIQSGSRLFGSEAEMQRFLKSLLLDEYKIYEMQSAKGDLVPYHAHAHNEIIVVLDGHMRLIVEEDIIDLNVMDVITIHAWAIHLAAFPTEGGARYYLCKRRQSA